MDYYKILECDRTATYDELKSSYRRLILSSHPDKDNKNTDAILQNHDDQAFLHIQKAWSVLKDPLTRKQYDAKLSCYEHSECFLYDTISLTDMEIDSEGFYTYPCRCGGTYVYEISDEVFSSVLVGCNECSFSIQVNTLRDAIPPQV